MSFKQPRGMPNARYGQILGSQSNGPTDILSFTDPQFNALTIVSKPPPFIYNDQDFPSFRQIDQGNTPTGNIPREELRDEENNIFTPSDPKISYERFLHPSDGRELAVNLTKMLIFVKKQEKMILKNGIFTNQVVTCMDPVTLNCHFAVNHGLYAGKPVQEIFSCFAVDGVVQSDNGEASNYVSNASSHRLIAIAKFGMTPMHNVWGSVRVGDRLGFILKPREPDHWVYYLSANRTRQQYISYNKSAWPKFCPWTFTPYRGAEDPLPSDLAYRDPKTNKECYGAFVFVGFCMSDKYENVYDSGSDQPVYMYDVSKVTGLQSVKVYLRPKVVFVE